MKNLLILASLAICSLASLAQKAPLTDGKARLKAMEERNIAKAKLLYDAIDQNDFYLGHALPNARSLMNITWNLSEPRLEKAFLEQATQLQMDGLKGHRSVGGFRASIYNAMPLEGCQALADFMNNFAKKNG